MRRRKDGMEEKWERVKQLMGGSVLLFSNKLELEEHKQ